MLTLMALMSDLDVTKSELEDWLAELLSGFSTAEIEQITEYLFEHPRLLARFLLGNVTLEQLFTEALNSGSDSEIEFCVPEAMLERWCVTNALAELVVFGGLSVLVALSLTKVARAGVTDKDAGSPVRQKLKRRNI